MTPCALGPDSALLKLHLLVISFAGDEQCQHPGLAGMLTRGTTALPRELGPGHGPFSRAGVLSRAEGFPFLCLHVLSQTHVQ